MKIINFIKNYIIIIKYHHMKFKEYQRNYHPKFFIK